MPTQDSTATMSAPETPDELIEAAKAYAETVPLDVPLHRVDWEVSHRAKTRSGLIEVHLLNGDLCNPITITLTWEAYEAFGWDRMQDTIRHELIHLWEYANFGESNHGDRFEQKAEELDASLSCGQFADPQYKLYCRGCGASAGSRYVRSKVVQAPHLHVNRDCDCDGADNRLRVVDTESGDEWTNVEEFRAANPDADDLANVHRYMLECADCGFLVSTRQIRSKPVKHPEVFGCDGCECDATLRVIDMETGKSWSNYEEMPSE